MTIREKIVLLAASAAILYGAFEVFLNPGTRSEGGESREEPLAVFINRVSMESGAGRLSPAEIQTIRQAEQGWRNPFKTPFLPPPDFERLPVYSGFVEMGGRKLAVVDGREYGVGENLEQSGYEVKEIAPDRILIGGEGRRSIPIPLLDTDRSVSP